MDIEKALKPYDVGKLIDSMVAYAYSRLKTVDVKNFEGKEPCDLVSEVFEKSMMGIRNWDESKVSFKEFLFGSLKSDIDAFFKKKKYVAGTMIDELSLVAESDEISYGENDGIEQKRAKCLKILSDSGSDNEELDVFSFWVAGITRPADIVAKMNIPVKDVYNITKRLERRLKTARAKLIEIL